MGLSNTYNIHVGTYGNGHTTSMLNGVIQRRALPLYQREEMKILNVSFPRFQFVSATVALTGAGEHSCASCIFLPYYYLYRIERNDIE